MKYAYGIDQTYDWVKSLFLDSRGRVLEVGCGNGRLAARIKADGSMITAIDRSENAVNLARNAGIEAIHADAALFTSNFKFDIAVLSMCAIHYHQTLLLRQ
ncbi:MAG: class I SAM-dependent methyltransferase [Proteobacteria bacterium]|nr:class I SAM-dependent methyltransferase [Pseudomonadota bacterium]